MAAGIRLVVFDMDGTITKPYINFKNIRAEIEGALGCPVAEPMLENMLALPPPHRRKAFEILFKYEDDACAKAELNDGVRETLAALRVRGVKTALLTRNSLRSVRAVLEKFGLAFDCVATREAPALKPDPRSVTDICARLDVAPMQTLVLGDFKYDLLVGRDAGTKTCLLTNGKESTAADAPCDFVIRSLRDLENALG